MLAAFKNIFKVPELRRKVRNTLLLLVLVRLGVFVPIPGVNTGVVADLIDTAKQTAVGSIIGILDMFSGGGLRNASLFALGIMPYITSSIIMQILTAVVPRLREIAKEGESGRRRIANWTRYLTVIICLVQAAILVGQLTNVTGPRGDLLVSDPSFSFTVVAVISMTLGTVFLMWLGDQVDEFGIGSGASLIIMVSIISRLPIAIADIANNFDPALNPAQPGAIGPFKVVVLLALFVGMVFACVMVTTAARKIPMQTPKRSRAGFRQQHYLPLKIGSAGVMAIIFAEALMIVPNFLAGLSAHPTWQLFSSFFIQGSWIYYTLYLLLILFFMYFYTAISFDVKERAQEFKQYGMFIPGIRPGADTRKYLEQVLSRVTFAGAIFIALIAVLPPLIQAQLNVDWRVSDFFGGTGLLITVGVALDLVQRIEAYMAMQSLDGFLGPGARMPGRR